MIDATPINTVFKTLLETHTEATFAMQSNNNRPRPDFPYATWDISTLTAIGHDSLLEPNDSGAAEILGDREFVIPFGFFGCNPVENLEHFLSIMRFQSVTAALDAVGVVFVQLVGSIQDLTLLVDTRYEYRAVMDLLFRIGTSVTDPEVGVIKGVKMDGKYRKEDISEKDVEIYIGDIPGGGEVPPTPC